MRIVDFLIADDIRFERGEKVSIIGVYNESISVEGVLTLPFPLHIGFYIRIQLEDGEKPDGFSIDIRSNETPIAEVRGTIAYKEDETSGNVVIAIPANIFPVKESGKFEVTLRVLQGQDEFYCEKRSVPIIIEHDPDAIST
ncbi:hypothetical protein KP005_19300 [Geomonas nitrogeniifigens]|uniref:Uncharacterized protein n=1 Tax=Geomonas diazotrophica TaxID=2843197 RepID=A0ABX8JIJ7_9BACT|nr:hypothetical protein [Geomonas nitrogeniifigens]QWV97454.1 hypothetical protein KP005_19300 [Geomonas nitrogeniifigens]